ncbi:MAG: geranylgeranylglyceryl/heptaprenylglyceryl phosphate synthase [Cytophagaceae bacterium]
MNSLYHLVLDLRKSGRKAFAVLLDPDKIDTESCASLISKTAKSKVDFFFVGGSLMMNSNMDDIIKVIKAKTNIPVIIFPGSNLHIYPSADAILFLSLISGRNPEYLIGQHVIAAPLIRQTGLEVMATGYILVDCGKPTTVSYISNTTPVPYDKPAVAACTAMAGEMLGLKLVYLDGGSGAQNPVSAEMIAAVRKSVNLPIIVGGGITSVEKALSALKAGADLIVIGNAIEKDPDLLDQVAEKITELNKTKAIQ